MFEMPQLLAGDSVNCSNSSTEFSMNLPIKLKGGISISDISDTSVTVSDKLGSNEFLLNEVVAVQVQNPGEVTVGLTVGRKFKFSVWFQGHPQPLQVSGKCKEEHWEILDQLLDQCIENGVANGMQALVGWFQDTAIALVKARPFVVLSK